MNKLKILLIISIFFITGCTVNYNLTISEGILNEEIEVIDYNSNNWDKFNSYGDFSFEDATYRDLINQYASDDFIINSTTDKEGIYKKELIDKDGGLGIKLKYDYELEEFSKQSLVYRCYKYFNVVNNENIYTISTSKSFMCFNNNNPLLGSVNINIKTEYNVINHNADSFKGNVYTWNITKENADDKQIILEFEVKDSKFNIGDIFSEDNMTLVIIISGIVIVGGVIFYYVFTKNKKNNII